MEHINMKNMEAVNKTLFLEINGDEMNRSHLGKKKG